MKKVLVLGCTGSIGTSTIDIIRNNINDFCICGLTAHSNKSALEKLGLEFNCPTLLTSLDNSESAFESFIQKCKPEIVVNGIAGAAGLLPSKIVIENKIDLALANKETIVMAGPLIKKLANTKDVKILPVDSEHSAIFNLINQCQKKNIKKIIITASGGPFRNYTKEKLKNVTLEDALKHPTWKMGKKITIDSSTLANKGLEVIEACYLFDMSPNDIQVVVHPQSLIHSLVQTNDGMLYAQISDPDMKHPIWNALTWPENKINNLENFNLFDKNMSFFTPNYDVFPMLNYAFECANKGLAYTIAYNACNEIAVWNFIDKKIGYVDIFNIVKKVLDKDWSFAINDFDTVFEVDRKARKIAMELL